MTELEVVTLMKSSKSEQEWNDNADEIKRKCKGYPEFWYSAIIISGIMHTVSQSWAS